MAFRPRSSARTAAARAAATAPPCRALGQWASSEQSADSSADSTQSGACNTNSPVRIKSRGDDGDVQAVQLVGGEVRGRQRERDQPVGRPVGRVGGVNVQALGQKA